MPRLASRDITYSLQENAATTGIIIPNSASLNPTAAIALEIWVKPFGGTGMTLFDNSTAGVTNSYFFYIDGIGGLYWYSKIGGLTRNLIGTVQRASPNEWSLISGFYDGANINLCCNGALLGQLAATGALGTNAGSLRIGQYYNGAVTQFAKYTRPRIYARVYTLQEHRDRYFAGRDDASMRANLVLDLRLTEGSGSTVSDSSGLNNHGTLSGATWSTDVPTPRRTAVSGTPRTTTVTRVAVRDLPASIKMNGSTSVISKSSPVGLPTGTSPRSVIVNMLFPTDDLSCVIDMHVNSLQSFGPLLGNLAGTYYWFSDRFNGGNNLTMTRDEFYQYIGLNRFRKIGYSYDGATTLKLYVDGLLVKTGTLVSPLNTGTINTLFIACGQSSAQAPIYTSGGYVQDAIICNAELTATEFANNYRKDIIPASAVSRIKGTDGSGSTAADSIGSNSCTLTSITWSTNTMFKARSPVT